MLNKIKLPLDTTSSFFYSQYRMSFLKNAIELVISPSHSRTTAILIIFLILAIVPLTVFIAQQQQEIRQRAAGPEVCKTIATIPTCDPNNLKENDPCSSKSQQCKIGNTVFECKEE